MSVYGYRVGGSIGVWIQIREYGCRVNKCEWFLWVLFAKYSDDLICSIF